MRDRRVADFFDPSGGSAPGWPSGVSKLSVAGSLSTPLGLNPAPGAARETEPAVAPSAADRRPAPARIHIYPRHRVVDQERAVMRDFEIGHTTVGPAHDQARDDADQAFYLETYQRGYNAARRHTATDLAIAFAAGVVAAPAVVWIVSPFLTFVLGL